MADTDARSPAAAPTVRAARPDDAPEIVRLAELMYVSLGLTLDDLEWESWRRAADRAVRAGLGPDLAVVVADRPRTAPGVDPGGAAATPGGPLVACGAGSIVDRLPNPSHADPRVGYVQWMSTEPEFRRRGLGRAVLQALLAWYDERGVDNVELHASRSGAPLYRATGFWEGSTGVALRRRPWDPPPS